MCPAPGADTADFDAGAILLLVSVVCGSDLFGKNRLSRLQRIFLTNRRDFFQLDAVWNRVTAESFSPGAFFPFFRMCDTKGQPAGKKEK
jgi:hypothetical protein